MPSFLWRSGAAFVFLVLGCSPAGSPSGSEPDADWIHLSGETFVGCSPGVVCDWTAIGNNPIDDFAFDGDQVIVVGNSIRVRLSLSTGKGALIGYNPGRSAQIEVVPAGIFAKGNAGEVILLYDRSGTQLSGGGNPEVDLFADVVLRLSPQNHVLMLGPLKANPAQAMLVDMDATVPAPMVTAVPIGQWTDRKFAVDEEGRVYFEPQLFDPDVPSLNVLDRTTGAISTVTYATPPAIPAGSTSPAFVRRAFMGPAPGGGILSERQQETGEDIVVLSPSGTARFVVHAELATSGLKRLRVRDGYLYAGGFGLWRTRNRVF